MSIINQCEVMRWDSSGVTETSTKVWQSLSWTFSSPTGIINPHICQYAKNPACRDAPRDACQVGALRDIKRDMAERRAALQKLIVQEVEARIFSAGEPATEATAAAGAAAAASQKAHQRSADSCKRCLAARVSTFGRGVMMCDSSSMPLACPLCRHDAWV